MSEPGPYEKPPPYSPPETQPAGPSNDKMHGVPDNFDYSKPMAGNQPAAPPTYYDGFSNYPQNAPINPAFSGLPNYGSTVYVQQAQMLPTTQVIIVGGCPACRVGVLEDDFTCLGICLALLCFPIGILCCLAMRQRRCPNCGAIFD